MEDAARHAREWEEPCNPGPLWWAGSHSLDAAPRGALFAKESDLVPVLGRKLKKASPTHKKALTAAKVREMEDTERAKASISVLRLVKLLAGDADGDKEDEYGALAPTAHALQTALLLVVGAIKIRGEDLLSSPVVDSEGGIRITWRRGDRQIKLVCPATKDAPVYIYQSFAGVTSLQNQNVTADVLAARLSLLIGRDSASQPAD